MFYPCLRRIGIELSPHWRASLKLFENTSARLVLVVDDDAAAGQVAFNALLRAGYAAALADSLELGHEYLRISSPFVILLSDSLASSSSATRFVENASNQDAPPVLVLMSDGFSAARARGEVLGIQEHLAKPLNPRQIKARMDRLAHDVPASVSTAALRDVRVLIVDDEADTRDVLAEALKGHGANILTAESAGDALARIDDFSPQVLLTDIRMPVEDGYSMLRKIRSRGNALPAIAFTAYSEPEDRMRAMAEGFQMHLKKPLDPQKLVHAVAMFAAQKK